MTLIGAILKKVHSIDSVKKYSSPPPEADETVVKKKKKKRIDKFSYVRPMVDSSAPRYDAARMVHALQQCTKRTNDVFLKNVQLLCAIAKTNISGGKVDSHWSVQPSGNRQFGENRRNACKLINKQNKNIHKRISKTGPRIVPTACLRKDWTINKRAIVQRARLKFVLFPLLTPELMEDLAFTAPHDVKRPRVYMTLQARGAAPLGELAIELFTDVCPRACRLFLDLLDGDGLGHSYVGTCFFRRSHGVFAQCIAKDEKGCFAWGEPDLYIWTAASTIDPRRSTYNRALHSASPRR